MPGQADDLVIQLGKNRGSCFVRLSFGSSQEVRLVALVNPAQTVSWITTEGLEQLQRWEFVDLGYRESYRLHLMSIQGQSIPDFEVRPLPSTRPHYWWDVIIGVNFFQHYTDIHLNIATSVARLIDP